MWWSIIFLAILIPFAVAGASFAPWVPTNLNDRKRIHAAIKLKKWETFLEFGCGDGRISHYIAKHNPESKIIGVEYAFPIYCVAKIRQFLYPLANLTIELWTGFKKNFKQYDVIYMFGMPDSIAKKILPKFKKEAKTGTRLVSYVFSFKDTDMKVKSLEKKDRKTIHILTK